MLAARRTRSVEWILTGKTRFRQSWWTGKVILQVEIKCYCARTSGYTYSLTRWDDAQIHDLPALANISYESPLT
jgi:hypothetical protein